MTTPGSHGPGEQPPSGGSGWGPPPGSPQPGGSFPGQQPGSVPPPQPGGQYPPQQGQFPEGQYPQQPGQFPEGQYPQQPGLSPAGPGWTPPQQPAKSGAGKWLAIAGGILAVVVIAIVAFAVLAGGDPEVGDCLQDEGEQNLSVVDCDDEAAAWKVVGIQDGEQSFDEYFADPETCSAFPDAVQSFWVGENGDNTGQGVVYCVIEN